MFFDILYNIFIYPIEFIIEILFYLFNNVFQSSYGISLFLLSLCINFLSLPLYNIAESWQAKERAIQDKMKPMIDNIKAVYKGDQRYLLIRTCQRINGYKTIYAFRGTLGLLIQIPFFMAAYNFVHSLTGLSTQSFLFIKDLSQPDALINIGNISINLLPFLMTLFSLLAGFVYARKLKFKESLPLYIVSLIFLVLLYNSPSGLLFYWTINCLFSLIKNLIIEYKLYSIFVKNKYKLLKAYNIFFITITVLFILLISLAGIERKAYLSDFEFINDRYGYSYTAKVRYYSKIFITSDIFSFIGSKDKFDDKIVSIEYFGDSSIICTFILKDNLENIKDDIIIYYRLSPRSYSINIYLFLLFITIIINMSNIYKFIFNKHYLIESFEKNRLRLMISSCLAITITSGLFILSSLISNSPHEFSSPFYLIINDLSMSIGLFFLYPMFIYVLFSEKIKNYLTLLALFFVIFAMINTFVMTGNYININNEFLFDNADLLKFSFKELLLSFSLTFAASIILVFVLRFNKSIFFININYIILSVLLIISILNISNIYKYHIKLKYIKNKNQVKLSSFKIFNLSKTGSNIIVLFIDKAVNSYWLQAFEKFPEYKEELDGFIIYPNTVSFSQSTITTASLYGGYDYLPYELSTNGKYILKNKHSESILTVPLSLEKYGYKSVLLEPDGANLTGSDLSIFDNYTNISAYLTDYIQNYSLNIYFGGTNINFEKTLEIDQKNKSIRFSLFRMMPINLRYSFYDNTGWFLSSTSFFRFNSTIRYYSVLDSITNFININENGNYYNMIYNLTTHDPYYFNSDFLPHLIVKDIDNKDLNMYGSEVNARFFYANVAAINSLIKIIKYLKYNNIYNNTKIIVVSDHGADVYNNYLYSNNLSFVAYINPILMFKDFNSEGNIKINTNFMTIADTPYLATKHIDNAVNPFNNKIITNDYKNNGVNIISVDSWKAEAQLTNSYNFNYYYFVKDNIFDKNNWKKFKIDWKNKESKQVELK
ncbi:membrane protein insertase YidC [uncultured Brachyspira sp.]|uniref:membrane protein insertase YidC n=5 Tax=uncultured Brachyspira sp. TaxID=221953 RepID=UPI0025D5CBE9|nr:membrane protein insertase YidC [uncultured Brachyspira sp.]